MKAITAILFPSCFCGWDLPPLPPLLGLGCLLVLVSGCPCAPRNVCRFFLVCSLVTCMLDWVTGVLCCICSLCLTLDFYSSPPPPPSFWKQLYFFPTSASEGSLLLRNSFMQSFELCFVFQSVCPKVDYFCIFFLEEMMFLLSLMLQVVNSRIMPNLYMDHCELT